MSVHVEPWQVELEQRVAETAGSRRSWEEVLAERAGLDGRGSANRQPHDLTSAEIFELARLDPSRGDRGRLRAIRMRTKPGSSERAWIDYLLDPQHHQDPAAAVPPNPMRVRIGQRHRELSAADRAWIDSLRGTNIAERDAVRLAEFEASVVEESDRRLIAGILAPVRRSYDWFEERAELQLAIEQRSVARVSRSTAVRDAWQTLAAERLNAERRQHLDGLGHLTPDERDALLRAIEQDAREEAARTIGGFHADSAADDQAAIAAARARLTQLQAGGEPKSSAPPPIESSSEGYEAGRARAAAVRPQPTAQDLLEAFGG